MRWIRVLAIAAVTVVALGLLAWFATAPRSAVDFGAWRVVVLQSDDWGLEGWFPDAESAQAMADVVESLPAYLRAYARGGLETAQDVRDVADVLASRRDADGLPLVLQANHIVGGASVRAEAAADAPFGWPVHRSGEDGGRYGREGLEAAVDSAIAAGVWWPELHGLTHFDLPAYARARADGDSLARRARDFDTLAYQGWLRHTELDGADPARARAIARTAAAWFEERFGRRPHSVIAPDYRWGNEDEDAWREEGLTVVQAKREQIDRSLAPHTRWGRVRKALRQQWQQRFSDLHYLDRPARLEPYGNLDPAAEQGALAAAAAVRGAWSRGEPGVISVHRIQLVAFDPEQARAGREQLLRCIDELGADGPLRFLVDVEVAQLQRRGWSRIERGPWVVVRNWTGAPIEVAWAEGQSPRSVEPGTHLWARGSDEPLRIRR